jgi:sec-independent protein translocase protein TatB
VPQIGPLEILVVAAVALIVFGPEKLPDLARKVGRTATELRRIANEAKAELQTDFSIDDDDDDEYARSSRASTTRRAARPRQAPADSASEAYADSDTEAPDDTELRASPAPADSDKPPSGDDRAPDEGDGGSDAARKRG